MTVGVDIFLTYSFILIHYDTLKPIKTSSAFGRDMSRVELWLALRASHKCFQYMAGPSGQPCVYL